MFDRYNKRRQFLSQSLIGAGGMAVANTIGFQTVAAASVSEGIYAVPLPERVSIPVAGSTLRFPVRRVYCLGLNYAAHTRETGQDPGEKPPLMFMKPTDAIVPGGGDVPYPSKTTDLHYEIEFVVAIGSGGSAIPEARALDHVYGYSVGLDMTRRDLQLEAMKQQRAWIKGKSFDYSAPCAAIQPANQIGHPINGRIWLELNGELRQQSDISKMIWNAAKGVSVLSEYFRLEPGDIIFTGTPEGIGQVQRGDELHGGVEGVGEIKVTIV